MSALHDLSPRDQERLSAYLDGGLSPREAAAVAARLEKEPGLRRALEDLRQVKAALAGLPDRPVPRNFTLRQADFPARAPQRSFAYLRLATVVASVLFVITSAVRLLPSPLMLAASAPRAAQSDEIQAFSSELTLGTAQAGAEAPTQAPAQEAAPAEPPVAAVAPAPTPTAAGTACPVCPSPLDQRKTEAGETAVGATAVGETAAALRTTAPTPVSPVVVVQWTLGVTAVLLGVLTVRARRSR